MLVKKIVHTCQYIKTTDELEKIVGTDCKMVFDNKGFGLLSEQPSGNRIVFGELYANKEDADELIKRINLYHELNQLS